MIAGTYAVSAFLLIFTGYLFTQGMLSSYSQTGMWTVIFFLRLPRRQLGISDRERDLPSGDKGYGHCLLLFSRHGGGGYQLLPGCSARSSERDHGWSCFTVI